jgi:hypothetical protein
LRENINPRVLRASFGTIGVGGYSRGLVLLTKNVVRPRMSSGKLPFRNSSRPPVFSLGLKHWPAQTRLIGRVVEVVSDTHS